MPTRDTAPAGAPCWVDLMTADTERSAAFYTQLLGWTATDPAEEFGGYFSFTRDGVLVAGCMDKDAAQAGADMPDAWWSVYLATDDAGKTLDAAAANGGRVHVPAMPVGDLGTMAFVGDPGGAGIGVWQAGTHQGFGVFREPGAPSWFELHTRDYDAVVAFYRDVFRWDAQVVSDESDLRYTVLKHGDDWLAGIMDAASLPADGESPGWSVYFGVDDTDAALERVGELGGSVLMPAEDTPYGRLAVAADPLGAPFKLVATNEAMPG